jgi:hypothetical protein
LKHAQAGVASRCIPLPSTYGKDKAGSRASAIKLMQDGCILASNDQRNISASVWIVPSLRAFKIPKDRLGEPAKWFDPDHQ